MEKFRVGDIINIRDIPSIYLETILSWHKFLFGDEIRIFYRGEKTWDDSIYCWEEIKEIERERRKNEDIYD